MSELTSSLKTLQEAKFCLKSTVRLWTAFYTSYSSTSSLKVHPE